MSQQTAWIFVLIAGLFEVGFAFFLKKSAGFTKLPETLGFGLCAMLSFMFLERAVRVLPIGTAYAVWTGIGAAGTVLIGIVLLRESTSFWRLAFLVGLIIFIAGVRLTAVKN